MADLMNPVGTTDAQTAGLNRAWQSLLSARTMTGLGTTGVAQPRSMTTTQTNYGIPQELLSEVAGAKSQLSSLAEQDPYASQYGAYENVIRQLANAYQTRGSRQARVARETGLASGLSPLETGALGEEALNQAMQQYYSVLPGLRLEQAGLQQKRWADLSDLMKYWTSLADIVGRGTVPLSSTGTAYEFQPSAAELASLRSQAQGQQGADWVRQMTPGWADYMLKLAQAAVLMQQVRGNRQMNEMFYGGGLGPIGPSEKDLALQDLIKRTVPGGSAEVQVSPSTERANQYENLLKFFAQLGESPEAMRGLAATGGQLPQGVTSSTAARESNQSYLNSV